MRCARSIACASTAGFHQGSSRKTYSAAVRFSPRPPAFRLIRNSPAAGIGLEAVHRRLRGRSSVRRDTRSGRRRRRAGRAAAPSRLVNCEKTSALWPSSRTSASCGRSASNFADGALARARIDQAGMARRLAQPQQRLEHVHLRSAAGRRARCGPAATSGSGRAARRTARAAGPAARSAASARCARAAPAPPAPSCGAG